MTIGTCERFAELGFDLEHKYYHNNNGDIELRYEFVRDTQHVIFTHNEDDGLFVEIFEMIGNDAYPLPADVALIQEIYYALHDILDFLANG